MLIICVTQRSVGKKIFPMHQEERNCNLAVSFAWSEATLALPMGELAAPKGQTERVPHHRDAPFSDCGTLSVSLFG